MTEARATRSERNCEKLHCRTSAGMTSADTAGCWTAARSTGWRGARFHPGDWGQLVVAQVVTVVRQQRLKEALRVRALQLLPSEEFFQPPARLDDRAPNQRASIRTNPETGAGLPRGDYPLDRAATSNSENAGGETEATI